MRIGEVSPKLLNRWIDEQGCIDRVTRKWAWWLNEDGTRGLAACHGTRYLYRGQNRRYWSVAPSISRGITTRALAIRDLQPDEQLRILMALIRADWYCKILKLHPVLTWANQQRYDIDRMALAQHYELPTGYVDLSESIEVALFFACCRFRNGKWEPLSEGKGILYRLDWIASQDQIGPRIKAIGLQPFPRPNAQWAWTIELRLHEDFEEVPALEAVEFNHTRELGERLLEYFNGGERLMLPDALCDWAHFVKTSPVLPRGSGVDVLNDISQDRYGVSISNVEYHLERLSKFAKIKFTSDPPNPFDEDSLASIATSWETLMPQFSEDMKNNTQVFLVRTPKESHEKDA